MENIYAKKSLGQNFLNSDGALAAMVEAGKVGKKDIVLEIGPGKGALTKRLLETGAKVIAIEKDDRLIPYIQELFPKEIQSKQLTLIHGDILELDVQDLGLKEGKYKIIANIPYYITGELIRRFLSESIQPTCMVILVQKEVAERIVVRDKKESLLSISVRVYGEPKYIQTVKAGSFFPAPNVDSAILLIDNISKKNFMASPAAFSEPCAARRGEQSKNPAGFYACEEKAAGEGNPEKHFFQIVRAGFAHKRKTISSNLKGLVSKEQLASLGINEKERAEKLPLSAWLALANLQ